MTRNKELFYAIAACIDTWPRRYDQWTAFIGPLGPMNEAHVDIFIEKVVQAAIDLGYVEPVEEL